MHATSPSRPSPTRALTLVVATCLLAAFGSLGAPASARANDYWVTFTNAEGEIGNGVNGFQWLTYGGTFSTYGGHCDASPGASFVAGAYCILRWNVPAGLTAGNPSSGGVARGTYRVGTPSFLLRTSRPGANPAYTSDAGAARSTHAGYVHGWGALGPYVETGLLSTVATTTSGTLNTWFHHDTFEVLLHDASGPGLEALSVPGGAGGWFGPGCHPMSYRWSDVGSQLWTTSVVNLNTGATHHAWAAAPGRDVAVSGVPVAGFDLCLPAPGTGMYTFRTTASDRSGAVANRDFNVSFDTTPPVVGAASVEEGAVFGSSTGYRPGVGWPIADGHSGVGAVYASIDDVPVEPSVGGGTASVRASAALAVGTHVYRLRVVDAVGNVVDVARTVRVVDDSAPALSIASPAASGDDDPLLDVTASDDLVGVDPDSWRVTVDGVPVQTDPTTTRLRLSLGTLVDASHTIVVRVADRAGNVTSTTRTYVADGSPTVPQLAADRFTGITVFEHPATVTEGETYRIRMVVARAGRPVPGRVELRSGARVLAASEVGRTGAVDMSARIDVAGPLSLIAPPASGLDAVTLTYGFTPRPPAPLDVFVVGAAPEAAASIAPVLAGAVGEAVGSAVSTVGPAVGAAVGDAIASTPGAAALQRTDHGFPVNVVYYVGSTPFWNGIPLAESGAPLDTSAPQWQLKLLQQRAGAVRRSRVITLQLWTNELALMDLRPAGGAARTTLSARRAKRTIRVAIPKSSALGRKLAAARAGSFVRVAIRIVATDKNENRSYPKSVVFRVRV